MVTHVVDRRGLRALLTAKIDAAVTLVADAAGWDKTLLAASWLEAGVADCAAAWGEPAVALPRLGAVRTCSVASGISSCYDAAGTGDRRRYSSSAEDDAL